jgi:hypothetical protein
VVAQAALRSFDASLPPVGYRMDADGLWVTAQIAKRSAYKAHLAKLLGIRSATLEAWDPRASDVIHIVESH